ncbi:hypothetical protein LMXM_23_1690 [Leishmania mexicana MHOM/GT/2001/U1103]|uniref:Adenylate kinase n=1 Tax=Leishmania mexicana (strain MHOM/GT/2001/U1103) TaxID=929439 RepID=E9AWG6_LEIMU|nr:hypothetical protein LMXM_23_1690 [Leishmania mexicana MHOM/GT/2001/U1103]CBZ27302.1 hypothetical protein LMXM_23_1690 [Leishmania mexicana MHOM/GT/2001/U1103]
MASAAYYKKQQAQLHLAKSEVQAIMEKLVAAVAQSRPRSPLRALLQTLDRIEEEGVGSASAAANIAPPLVTPRLIVLTGPPGCGKSVQASHIAAFLGGVHCALPSLVRDAFHGGHLPGSKVVYVPESLQAEMRAAKEAFVRKTPVGATATSFLSSLPPDLAARLIANCIQYEMRQRQAAADTVPAPEMQCPTSTVFFVLDGYPSTIAEALALEAATGQEVSVAVTLRCSADCLEARRHSRAPPGRLASLDTFEAYWSAQHKLRVVDGAQSIAAVTRQVLAALEEE